MLEAVGSLLDGRDGMLRVRNVNDGGCALACLDRVSISALTCEVRADHLEFRYVF